MPRHDTLIIKDTHRGLLYEDGVFRDLLPAGRYQIPRAPGPLASFFGAGGPSVDVVLIDVRGRDRTVAVHDLLTADGATISATFAVQFRVVDPLAAVHNVKNFEERLYAEAQTAARRVLRGLSVEEVLASRDEVGEEMLVEVRRAVEAIGLEVAKLDFKDLVVPEELRKIMNRAVIARRLRQARMVDGLAIDDDELAVHDDEAAGDPAEDDSGLIIARASFAGAAADEPEARPIRPSGREPWGQGSYAGNPDAGLLRYRQ